MKLEILQTNEYNTIGFVRVKEFKGAVIRVAIGDLLGLSEMLKALKKQGFTDVEIGIENNLPLVVFLSEDRTVGYGIVPR